MKRDWRKERWRKQHIREPVQERLWPVMARGLREYLRMLAEDDGALIRRVDDPIAALLKVLAPEPAELDLVRQAVSVLLRDGFLELDRGSLRIPSLPESQAVEPREADHAQHDSATAASSSTPSAQTSTKRVQEFRRRQRERNAESVSGSVSPSISETLPPFPASVSDGVSSSRGDGHQNPPQQPNSQKDSQLDLPLQTRAAVAHAVSGGIPSVSGDDGYEQEERGNARSETHEHALSLPVRDRAALVAEHPELAGTLKPHEWPEVVAVATALARAEGQERALLAPYERDPGVRNLVALYATGVSQAELEAIAATVPQQPWWRASGKRLGLESLTINVVRRNRPRPRARARDPSPRVAEVLARLAREREAG